MNHYRRISFSGTSPWKGTCWLASERPRAGLPDRYNPAEVSESSTRRRESWDLGAQLNISAGVGECPTFPGPDVGISMDSEQARLMYWEGCRSGGRRDG